MHCSEFHQLAVHTIVYTVVLPLLFSTGPSKRFELRDLFHPWVDSRVSHVDWRVLPLHAHRPIFFKAARSMRN
jgi:hypothetical protein